MFIPTVLEKKYSALTRISTVQEGVFSKTNAHMLPVLQVGHTVKCVNQGLLVKSEQPAPSLLNS
jgi:hypothetical protein